MKRKSNSPKVIIALLVLAAVAAGYIGVKLFILQKEYDEKSERISEINAIPSAEINVDYEYEKPIREAAVQAEEGNSDGLYNYEYNNIQFISYSKEWDAKDLELLCGELYKNKHGSEIDFLEKVIVYGEDDEDALGVHEDSEQITYVPLTLYSVFPDDFKFQMRDDTSIITLYGGDSLTTIEQMASTLSHEYGHHFTLYYFNLEGDKDAIEKDPYFEARYVEGSKIIYADDSGDWNYYLDNHMWYLIEIAAEDYVYLMGSPNTRRSLKYYDTLDVLRLYVQGKDEQADEYYEYTDENSFNLSPHENIVIPLPDNVEGLAELFYEAIGMDVPVYEDRSLEAESIKIKITAREKMDKRYYNITWNKPWEGEDVTYTLVAYDENDEIVGAVKSITGDEKAVATIGAVVYETQNYYHYYDSDYWTELGFVRFRVVATFSDGTAAISPPIDRRF